MRNPERVERILKLILSIWIQNPDLRFFQLIYNLQQEYSELHNGVGKVIEVDSDASQQVGFDLFNLEDDQVEPFLEEYLRKLNKQKR